MQSPAIGTADATEQEYRAIEATLLQTARGRWFLAEHGRRARRLDSRQLEDALQRLQSTLREPPALLGQLKAELEAVQTLIGESKRRAISRPADPMPAPPPAGAQAAPDVGPGSILRAAEDIHELAWAVQSGAPDAERSAEIARHAARLYAMSLQQAVESERVQRLVASLDDATRKISAVLETIAHESHDGDVPPPPADAG
jgi:hypothetical protein